MRGPPPTCFYKKHGLGPHSGGAVFSAQHDGRTSAGMYFIVEKAEPTSARPDRVPIILSLAGSPPWRAYALAPLHLFVIIWSLLDENRNSVIWISCQASLHLLLNSAEFSCRKTFLQLTLWQMLRCDEKTCNFAREINVERFGLLATTVKNAKRKILPFMQMHAYPLSDPGF